MRYTTGTWRVGEFDRRIIVDDEDNVIADVRTALDTDDVYLLSAAKELLEAIEFVVDEWNNDSSGRIHYDKIMAAIDKAKGY